MLQQFLQTANDYLYSYLMIGVLFGCGIYFTIRTKGVQFRLFKDSCRLLFKDGGSKSGDRHISSFQAFAVALASRVGTGNLAGVATAITIGGPGAVFWMWITALLGSATAFVEATMAQLYKRKDNGSFVGGPAYYIDAGLKKSGMAALSALLIILTFSFGFTLVQCNTIGTALNNQFGINTKIVGIFLALLFLLIISGGIQRIAKFSSIIVPIMTVGYIILAIVVLAMNVTAIPKAFELIFESAFGFKQATGGLVGAAIIQGVRRGLFSNEAGIGSAANVAATADVSHPVKQGLVQSLGVFMDTIVICTCTALVIILSGVDLTGAQGIGIDLTQAAMTAHFGKFGSLFLTIIVFFFAYSTVIGNYSYGEINIPYFTNNKRALGFLRVGVAIMAFVGTAISLQTAWMLTDILMAFAGLLNLIALVVLFPKVKDLLNDYSRQRSEGIKDPKYPDWWEEEEEE